MDDKSAVVEYGDGRKGPERRLGCPYPDCRRPNDTAERAAEKAVHLTFAIIGVNVDEPKEVEEFRQDLRFGNMMRKVANKGVFTLVVVIAAGLGAAVWVGIKTKFIEVIMK